MNGPVFDNSFNLKTFLLDEDVACLFEINSQMALKMKNVDIEKLEFAIKNNKESEIANIIGFTTEQMNEISNKIQLSAHNIIYKYPSIEEELAKRKEKGCVACESDPYKAFEKYKNEVENSLDVINSFRNFNNSHDLPIETEIGGGDDGCKDSTSYIFCCIACAAAPVTVWAYPACVYLCYKAFC